MFRKLIDHFRRSPYPRLASADEIGKALVISPHPDDDVIGLGGTLYRIRDRVTVVHVTSGERGIPETAPKEAAEIRRGESKAAATVIGLPDDRLIFLEFSDGKTGGTGKIARSLAEVIERHSPDDLFAPSPIDSHPDHRNVAGAVGRALGKTNRAPRCWVYEVWTPLFANAIIDISDLIEIKREAIRTHISQVSIIDYAEKVTGLNAFRSISESGVSYAEAFYVCDPGEYRDLVRNLTGDG